MNRHIAEGFSLAGNVAVITGAASGIGRASAILLAEAGARVVISDVDNAGLESCAAAIGDAAIVVPADVSDRQAVDRLAETALETAGHIDVWANVAGIIKPFPIVEADEALLDQTIAVNLKGTYWGCAAAARAMRESGGGSIINMSSAGAESSPAGLSAYALTKAGINALTRTAAREFGPWGVRVNAVAPGFVETPLASHHYTRADGTIDDALREETLKPRRAASPLGITGEPLDIAYAVLYLAGSASRFMTGQVVRPNGGAVMI